MGDLRYIGPEVNLSDGGVHKPSIWYIADEKRFLETIEAIDQPDGFAPYGYAFTKKGRALYEYFSIARYDFRDRDRIVIPVGSQAAEFSVSTLKGKLPEIFNRTIEDFRMLYCDYIPADSDDPENIVHTLIFPINRGFFHLADGKLTIIGAYYGIDRDLEANTYSILINGDFHSGPFDIEDMSGFDWLESSIYRNIGEWRRNNGIR